MWPTEKQATSRSSWSRLRAKSSSTALPNSSSTTESLQNSPRTKRSRPSMQCCKRKRKQSIPTFTRLAPKCGTSHCQYQRRPPALSAGISTKRGGNEVSAEEINTIETTILLLFCTISKGTFQKKFTPC